MRTVSGSVVFVPAHLDDEAIFTGGTIVRLVRAGVDVVLVVAPGGELGDVRDPPIVAEPIGDLAACRRAETEAAAALLGVGEVISLGYRDSGMAGTAGNAEPGAFAAVSVAEAADRLAEVLRRALAGAVVGYDDTGIYGHPDHIQVTRIVHAAAAQAGVPTVYGATVDREYLHFVERHAVAEAALVDDLGSCVRTSAFDCRGRRRRRRQIGAECQAGRHRRPRRPDSGDVQRPAVAGPSLRRRLRLGVLRAVGSAWRPRHAGQRRHVTAGRRTPAGGAGVRSCHRCCGPGLAMGGWSKSS